MTKKVNIYTRMPITVLKFPISGNVLGITLEVEDICKCICSKAKVDEILEDGSIVRLDLANYNKDNSKKKVVPKPAPKVVEEKKIEVKPIDEVEPVVEKEPEPEKVKEEIKEAVAIDEVEPVKTEDKKRKKK